MTFAVIFGIKFKKIFLKVLVFGYNSVINVDRVTRIREDVCYFIIYPVKKYLT